MRYARAFGAGIELLCCAEARGEFLQGVIALLRRFGLTPNPTWSLKRQGAQ
jgi:hypothetical protein